MVITQDYAAQQLNLSLETILLSPNSRPDFTTAIVELQLGYCILVPDMRIHRVKHNEYSMEAIQLQQ